MSLNRVILIGNLTRDPEIKYSPQGVTFAHCGIAVNRYSKNEQGDYDVDFFNWTAFRKTADYAGEWLKKGSRVAIEGRLQTRSWTPEGSDHKVTVYEIIVDNIQNLTPREGGEGNAEERVSQKAQQTAASSKRREPQPANVEDIEDEADPFADM